MEEHFGKPAGGDHLSVLRHLPTAVDLWRHDHQYLYDFLGEPAADAGSQPRVVALLLLLLMAFVIWFGKDLMVKVMSYLVWPFIASPVVISCP